MSNRDIEVNQEEAAQKGGSGPSLRFPDFQGANDWNMKRLEDVAPLQRGFDLPSTEIRPGTTPVYYSNGVQSFHEEARAQAPGLVTGRSGTIGKLHFIEEGDYWPHNTCLWVTSFNGNVPKFVYYLYKFIGMARFASGSGVPTLNRNDVHAFCSYVPVSAAEQEKIADCLSSADQLITAETRKLDTLKAHKLGLMQQLFPVEGEAVPRLRFFEFVEAEEWVLKPLGELAENVDNRRVPVTESDRASGDIPYYGASGIIDYIDSFIFDENLLCISEDGANLKDRTYPVAFSISGKTWVNNHAHVLRFVDCAAQKIVEEYINSISLEDFLTGMAQPKLNRSMLDSIPMALPTDEEERKAIANCLSLIDDVISRQKLWIEQLRVHKQGLMQQLFLVAGEVRA